MTRFSEVYIHHVKGNQTQTRSQRTSGGLCQTHWRPAYHEGTIAVAFGICTAYYTMLVNNYTPPPHHRSWEVMAITSMKLWLAVASATWSVCLLSSARTSGSNEVSLFCLSWAYNNSVLKDTRTVLQTFSQSFSVFRRLCHCWSY